MPGRNSIVLRGDYIQKEGEASVAVKPGMLVEWDGVTIGTTLGVRPCTKAGVGLGATRKAFALENDLIGQGKDDNYDVGDTVKYGVFQRGAEVQAILASGVTSAIGDALTSNGNGHLKKAATTVGADDEEIVAYAMEAVVGDGVLRVRVEVA